MSERDDQELAFPETLGEVVALLLYRLGDTQQQVWDAALLERFFIRGTDVLAKECRVVWDMTYFPDEAGVAVHTFPESLLEVDRCTWDYKRMSPTSAIDLQRFDYAYRVTRGDVYAYIQDSDGLREFRKIRVPASNYIPYVVLGDGVSRREAWGIMRSEGTLEGTPFTTIGTWGLPRRIPYLHPTHTSNFGLARRPEKELRNVRVEHYRRPLDPRLQNGGRIELPAPYLKFCIWYALWHALEMDGPGQDVEMAQHYQARWLDGIARARKRQEMVDRFAFHRMGGGHQPIPRPPRPQLPWQYGEPVD